MKYLVRSGALSSFAELVEELGQKPLALLDQVGLPVRVLQEPDLYMPYHKLAELLTLTAQRCRAPDFGVRLGSRQGLDAVGALGTWLCLQPRISDALALIQKNVSFHARGVDISTSTKGDQVSLTMSLAIEKQTDCFQLLTLSMALLVRSLTQLHATDLKPLSIEFALPAPRDVRSWQRVFGTKAIFNTATTRLTYPASVLAFPVRIDAEIRERLSTQWRGDQRQAPVRLDRQVERAIVALLPTGDCSLERVAHLVDLQPRTLQAQLQRDQLSFGVLLRQAREKLAREHLANSDIDLTTLAMNLGFGELAVFSRAFKSWTGVSPRAWRSQENS